MRDAQAITGKLRRQRAIKACQTVRLKARRDVPQQVDRIFRRGIAALLEIRPGGENLPVQQNRWVAVRVVTAQRCIVNGPGIVDQVAIARAHIGANLGIVQQGADAARGAAPDGQLPGPAQIVLHP